MAKAKAEPKKKPTRPLDLNSANLRNKRLPDQWRNSISSVGIGTTVLKMTGNAITERTATIFMNSVKHMNARVFLGRVLLLREPLPPRARGREVARTTKRRSRMTGGGSHLGTSVPTGLRRMDLRGPGNRAVRTRDREVLEEDARIPVLLEEPESPPPRVR